MPDKGEGGEQGDSSTAYTLLLLPPQWRVENEYALTALFIFKKIFMCNFYLEVPFGGMVIHRGVVRASWLMCVQHFGDGKYQLSTIC